VIAAAAATTRLCQAERCPIGARFFARKKGQMMKLPAFPLPAALLLAALSGCSNDAALRPDIQLDIDTCETREPGDVSLRCGAMLGIWLRTTGTARIVDQACIDLDEESGLEDLEALVRGVSLSTDPSIHVSAQVAVYAPWSAADGCLPPDLLAAEGGVQPEILLRGTSGEIAPLDVDGKLDILLSCVRVQPGGEECQQDCRILQDLCIGSDATVACTNQRADCLASCDPGDESCPDLCDDEYEVCLFGSVDGRCQAQYEGCASGCGSEACSEACLDDFYDCLEEGCAELFQDCEQECPGTECASFPPR
jgi:hypothetical protein